MTARISVLTPLFALFACASAPLDTALAADTYEIDAGHSHVQFSVRRFGFNDVIGGFGDVKGTITLDEDAPENSRVEVEIATASIVSGNEERDGHLAGKVWFNTESFPTMTFISTSVERIDETTANVTGDLNLLGISKPVTLHVTFNKIGTDPSTKAVAVGFSATTSLDRTDFGMDVAANFIGNDVAIRIEMLAHKTE